jgi:hypothetical protein
VKIIKAKMATAFADDRTVERAEGSKAPTAFRVWKAGENVTDHGKHVLTRASVEAILADQERRQNLSSIDVDHLSLSKDAPPEARKAVGWNRWEARTDESGNLELWACNVQWTDAVRAGFDKDPPEWRYFSPAYGVNDESGEILRVMNMALTNNPATWGVTALATATRESPMTFEELMAALKALAEAGDESAKKLLAGATPAAPESTNEVAASEDEPAEETPAAAGAAMGEEPAEKPAASTISASALAQVVQVLASKVSRLERASQHTEREALIRSRPDLAPELVAILANAKLTPIEVVREACKSIKRKPRNPAAEASSDVQATRGETQANGQTSALPPKEAEELRRRMGMTPRTATIREEGGAVVFASMRPSEARAFEAAKKEGAK